MAHLDGFAGTSQAEGDSGYRRLAAKNTVSLAFCWARRARASMNWPLPVLRPLPGRYSDA